MAYSWCSNTALADDLVQEAIVKALENRHQLKKMTSIHSWMFRILHNCWLSYLRRLKPETDIDTQTLSCKSCPEQSYERNRTIIAVRMAVSELPVGQRSVLTLVDLEGFSYKEVSEILEIPIGTVMSRLSRARRALEESINKSPCATELVSGNSYLRSVK